MNEEYVFSALTGDYYARCNTLFRSLTNQAEIMLAALYEFVSYEPELSILSVGSGIGLFEVPLLEKLFHGGILIPLFIGIDNDEYACKFLGNTLSENFGATLRYEVLPLPFQRYQTTHRFELILFNHVFEYFADSHLRWIQKSLALRTDTGKIMIFSPNRGGINKIYGEMMRHVNGFDPFFADDLSSLLSGNAIKYSSSNLLAVCDISLLEETDENSEKIMLLSFLTQIDCRKISPEILAEYSTYYKSIRNDHHIPHPTTLFVL